MTNFDGPEGRPRDAVHLVFAGEKVRREYHSPAPRLIISEQHDAFKLLELEPLVTMKLTSFRLKDRVHLLDMIDVGLVDATWCERLPPELAKRRRLYCGLRPPPVSEKPAYTQV